MTSLWVRDPKGLSQPSKKQRTIRGGKLLDLAALQKLVELGSLGENDLWVATDSCERDLENYRWSYEDVFTHACVPKVVRLHRIRMVRSARRRIVSL